MNLLKQNLAKFLTKHNSNCTKELFEEKFLVQFSVIIFSVSQFNENTQIILVSTLY